MKIRNLVFGIVLLGMCNSLLVACKSLAQKNSADVQATIVRPAICSTEGDNPLEIVPAEGVKLTPAASKKEPQLPLKYTVYTINNEQMQAFFKAIKTVGKGSINLPVPGQGCQTFQVEPSGTMSAVLAEKYPEITSLKGTALDNKNGFVRIDYDTKKLYVEITWNHEVYYLHPWKENNQLWYVLSHKKDTGYEKRPFE